MVLGGGFDITIVPMFVHCCSFVVVVWFFYFSLKQSTIGKRTN